MTPFFLLEMLRGWVGVGRQGGQIGSESFGWFGVEAAGVFW
jgi:hypothetical protein